VLPPEIVCAHPVQGHSIPSDAEPEACAHAARSLYEKSQDDKTICLWQFCVQKGYPLFKRDLEQLANALTDTNRCQDAYNLWKWFSENHPSSISGDHYGKYATYAFNAGEHALSYQMIRKHLVMSEYVKPSDYFTAAQASVFLKKFEDALKYYKEYFATQNPAYVPAAAYVNAAVTYHHLADHKAAAKSMDIFFERYPNEKPEAFVYENAGKCAYFNNEPEKAVRYFNQYFSMPASKASRATYVFAGQAHTGSGNQKLAIHYLEKYFELTPKSDWIPRSVFTLGYQYRQLGDYAKACYWFNHVFFKMNL
jgi:tetratricopeptide (TPR) repeat protein